MSQTSEAPRGALNREAIRNLLTIPPPEIRGTVGIIAPGTPEYEAAKAAAQSDKTAAASE